MNIKKGIRIALRIICFGIIIWAVMYGGLSFQDEDVIKYEGKKYVPVEFGQDIFMYYCNEEKYSEEGEIQHIEGVNYDMITCEGDLYCIKSEADAASGYYADDANYDWYTVIDKDGEVIEYPITVTADEMAYLNSIEGQPQDKAIFFDEIEAFGTLMKSSKDGMISGVTELAYYDGSWYWRSEVIDEKREKGGTWPEYVYELPDALSVKITNVIK